MDETFPIEDIAGVLLAGGNARRMGGCDKCLLPLDNQPILEHVIRRAQPQVSTLILNTNSDPAIFSRYSLRVIQDTAPGLAGPLGGVSAAMEWIRSHRRPYCWLASFPTDSPFFPQELVKQLYKAATESNAKIACAASNHRRSPLFALWSMDLLSDLQEQLKQKQRKVGDFLERHDCAVVSFDSDPVDPFFNINTVEDLKAARELVERTAASG